MVTCSSGNAFNERRVDRFFSVIGQGVVRLDSHYGAINIIGVPGSDAIRVTVIQSADVIDPAEMDRRLRMLDLRVEQNARGEVVVEARYRSALQWSWSNWPPLSLVFEIKVPQRCDVEVRNGEGGIVVGSLQGRLDLRSESGSIFTKEIDGSVKARNQAGAIAITACTGMIDAETLSGNFTVGRAGGRTVLASNGGYIELQRALGEVRIRGDGSDVQVGFSTPILHSADIAVTGGSLALQLETTAACVLDLRASVFGRVDVRGPLPLTVDAGGEGKSSLRGRVNGGGPSRIAARVSGGNVVVRGVEPLFEEGGTPVVQHADSAE